MHNKINFLALTLSIICVTAFAQAERARLPITSSDHARQIIEEASFNHDNFNSIEQQRLLAPAYLRLGQFPQALASAEKVLAKFPTDADALQVRGDVLRESGLWDKALNDYQTALKGRPEDTDLLIRVGAVLQKLGKNVEADKVFVDYQAKVKRDSRTATTEIEQ